MNKHHVIGIALALLLSTPGFAAKPKLRDYPLKICLVSDNKLGSMGNRTSSRTKISASCSAASRA